MTIPLLIFIVGEVALIAGLVMAARHAFREHALDRSLERSLRRIRARLIPHRCPTCGLEHGGIGW